MEPSSLPAPAPEHAPPPELVVITGMSGAGRSTAAKVLEDLGWYVVDNLPPQMLAPLADLTSRAAASVPRVAVVLDVRGRSFSRDLDQAISGLGDRGVAVRVVFLEADDATLVRRFEQVRRPHPLQGDGRILDGIAQERDVLGDLRGRADILIDTSRLNVHELAHKVAEAFTDTAEPVVHVTVLSFGFKYGVPVDADNVADVRFLPNPFWNPELRPHTGLDEPVSRYVLAQSGAGEFLERYTQALTPVLAGYARENKRYATIAVGCTGGKHRSVAMAEALAGRLRVGGATVRTVHRDLGRE
jgi:RNase adapter protein RapZ